MNTSNGSASAGTLYNLREQYILVKASRAVLLDYCATISHEDFVVTHPDFGRGSVRNLLVHIANVYEFWIGANAMKRNIGFTSFDDIQNVERSRKLFTDIDNLTEAFFDFVTLENPDAFLIERNGVTHQYTPVALFTHVITHEFHHKGQLLTLSRILGYIPPDTDIIR